jgi:dTMP kinase
LIILTVISNSFAPRPYLRIDDAGEAVLTQSLVILGAHAFKYESIVRPALRNGKLVLVDRYVDSVYAYQLPLLVSSGMIEEEATSWLCSCLSALPLPDLTIYVTTEGEQAATWRHVRGDDPSLEDRKFLDEVAVAYEHRLQTAGDRVAKHVNQGPLINNVERIVQLFHLDAPLKEN